MNSGFDLFAKLTNNIKSEADLSGDEYMTEQQEDNVIDFKEELFFDMDVKVADSTDDDGNVVIEGFASTFGNIDFGNDVVEAGAFKKTIKNRKSTVKMLFNHDPSKVLGVWTNMKETSEGLMVKGIIPKSHPRADEIRDLIKIGALESMSIGFIVREFTIKDGVRFIQQADLKEISIVTFPMNPEAAITAVKAEDELKEMTVREIEELLKSTGAFSNKACTALASSYEKQRDSADLEEKDIEDEQRDSASVEDLDEDLPDEEKDSKVLDLLADIKSTFQNMKEN